MPITAREFLLQNLHRVLPSDSLWDMVQHISADDLSTIVTIMVRLGIARRASVVRMNDHGMYCYVHEEQPNRYTLLPISVVIHG
jgi:hypothetical protein